jgi:hypothetical protein
LLVLLIAAFVPTGAPVVIGLDDTIERRWGPKIQWQQWSGGYPETLAGLARLVIADVTDATEVRVELHNIVPAFPSLPIQPILLRGQPEFVTHLHLQDFPWFLPTFEYDDLGHLLANLDIVADAEAKVKAVEEALKEARRKIEAQLSATDDEVHQILKAYAFVTPLGHLDQAIEAHTRGDWAACNSQLRTFLESLFVSWLIFRLITQQRAGDSGPLARFGKGSAAASAALPHRRANQRHPAVKGS